MSSDPQSVPLKPGRKRKRASVPPETSRPEDPANQAPLNVVSLSPTGSSENDSPSSAPQNPKIRDHAAPEWPEEIVGIERTHRALNIVFTFCCTRKHVVTAFDNIKAAVESHLGKPLTVEDVAAVVAIRPEAIKFAYVDELTLQNDAKGSERDTAFKTATPKDIRSQGPPADASVGGFRGNDSLGSFSPFGSADEEREVLFFEFVDGDVKPQSSKTPESNTGPVSSSRTKTFKLPLYSHESMSSLIDRRNQKFSDSLTAFVDECTRSQVDPWTKLKE
ncbi:hypothetical protein IMZ48_05880, partial [Candidatus Bathyarchaeota archaeon]|nr:hypothetical protein [Candidatus Bathyarchaeota archaeon]